MAVEIPSADNAEVSTSSTSSLLPPSGVRNDARCAAFLNGGYAACQPDNIGNFVYYMVFTIYECDSFFQTLHVFYFNSVSLYLVAVILTLYLQTLNSICVLSVGLHWSALVAGQLRLIGHVHFHTMHV